MRSARRLLNIDTNSSGGFTLLEVLLATGILAAAIAWLMHLFAVATRANLDARGATYGVILAAQKVEQLRAAPFPVAPVEDEDALDSRGLPVDPALAVPAYRRRWIVAPLPASPERAVAVTVEVATGGTYDHRAVRITTIRAGRP